LLDHTVEIHKNQEIIRSTEIAPTEGYLSKDGHLTAAG